MTDLGHTTDPRVWSAWRDWMDRRLGDHPDPRARSPVLQGREG